ncbi:hypothetical protein LG322_06200 [Microbacterium aerolatum]|uniref:ATP synthase protein I n=1 Tax=Microbacterium aerolatum TaxID=153731 RepID=A0A511AA56_9MICO|nr:hypothetical protein [Microbacterium aerolatum]MCK3768444.1 hypothetical protein [Microbacterium aerolatum]GEK85069.1 hypothetical protein MAE01_02450 [Microbacterium aerolatum]GGB38461.1 hypothetical protein GCM10007198_31260 [Microbacterium aerolatum]
MSDTPEPSAAPAINPVLRTVLLWTGIAAVALIVLGGGIGYLVAGADGLWSGLAGVGLAVIFLVLTPISVLVANRWYGKEMFATVFFGIVMGGWLLKLVIFIVAIVILRGQSWVVPEVIFLSLVAGIVVSLVIDGVAFTRLRVPHVSDVALPTKNPEEHEDS